jgi:hypothetical protein
MAVMHSKQILVNDLVMMGKLEGFSHSNRFQRHNFKALSPDEMPGYRVKKFMEREPERALLLKELKAADFNHRQF